MSSIQPQVIVIGGGPGGSSAAALLASWGHDVALIARPIPPAGWLAESIPASTWKLLDAVGMRESVETARFFPNGGNTVWWAGRPERSEAFAGGAAGVHVGRAALEEVMLSGAERRGVVVSRDAPVRSVERGARGWSVEWGDSEATAPWILDASGRAGVVARRTRVEDRPTGTIALVGRWRREGGWGGDRTHTLIESYEDGWVWSVPVSNEVRCVTAMVDPRETDLERSGGIAAMLATELEKAPHIRARLDGATPDGDARACPASLYTSEAFAADGTILVGDAG
ncbi:MAG: NAD(P)/FAD-dependent oxidoreductase, partial [Gemmatimonadota bacterium]